MRDQDDIRNRIKSVLRRTSISKDYFSDKTVEELISEISIYHQELEYQNDELKRIGVELEQSREHFFSLFENAPIGYIIFDQDYNIVSGNNQICKYFEIEKDLLLKSKITNYISVESQDTFYFHVRNLMKIKSAQKAEVDFKISHKTMHVYIESNVFKEGGTTLIRSALVDQTEEWNAKAQLRESELLYRNLFENSNDAIYLLRDRKFELVNDKFCELLEISREELASDSFDFMQLVAPSSIQFIKDRGEAEKRGEIVSDRYQFTALSKKGKELELDVSVRKIFLKNGVAYQGILRDMTEIKRNEKVLAENERKYRQLAYNMTDVVWTSDLNLKVNFISPSVKKLFNETPEEHMKRSLEEKIPESSLVKIKEILFEELKKEKKPGVDKQRTLLLEIQHYDANKNIKWVAINAKFLRDENGNPFGVQGVTTDITERKLVDGELKRSEDEKSKILSATLSGLFIYDIINRKFEYTNPAYTTITGWNIDELNEKGEGFFSLFHPDDKERVMQHFSNLFNSEDFNKSFYLEYRYKTKSDHWIWIASYDKPYLVNKNKQITHFIGSFVDITMIKKVEMELRESEERFRTIFDGINSVAVQGYLEDGTVLYWNHASELIYGYSREEAIGNSLYDLIIPADMNEETKMLISEMYKTSEPIPAGELGLKRKDGSIVNVYSNHTVINVMGKRKEMYCIDIDLSERREFEEQLRFHSKMLDEIGESVIASNNKGEIIYWNKAAERLYGWTRQEVMGELIVNITPSIDKVVTAENIMNELWKGNKWSGEIKLKRKDGTEFIAFVTDAPIYDEGGEIIGIIGVSTDISKMKTVEKELREKNEFIHEVVHNLPIGIALNRFDEKEAFLVNKRFEEIYGWKEDDVKNIDNFFEKVYPDPDYRRKIKEMVMADIRSGDPEKMKWENVNIVTESGEKKIINAQNIPLHKQKTMVSTVLDMTAQKKAEEALWESKRLSAIGEMSSAIAHDFNNSLQAIYGNLELALISIQPENNAIKYLSAIKTAALDSASRIKLLQRFAGNIKTLTEFHTISISGIIEEVKIQSRPLWKDMMEKSGYEIEFKNEVESEIFINGNEPELRSLFYNLIKNGIEAMPQGGKLTITSKTSNEKVFIDISDTGIGMDEDIRRKIFQPYFSTKGFGVGRGIGMSSAYSIVREHGGEIYIKETRVNAGTTIEIVLPIVNAGMKSIPVDENKLSEVRSELKIRVLWVDDDENIRGIANDILNLLGVDGKVVSGGKEALEMMEAEKFNILLTDIGMPGMSGWELAEKTVALYGDKIQIAALTGWGEEVSDLKREQYKIQYVLSKPFKISQIKKMLDTLNEML